MRHETSLIFEFDGDHWSVASVAVGRRHGRVLAVEHAAPAAPAVPAAAGAAGTAPGSPAGAAGAAVIPPELLRWVDEQGLLGRSAHVVASDRRLVRFELALPGLRAAELEAV